MTFTEHISRLADQLAALAVSGASRGLQAGLELDVAMGGRQAALQLLRNVLSDTTGISAVPGDTSPKTRISDLAGHPVSALAWAVNTHPAVGAQRSLLEAYATAKTASSDLYSADQSWALIGRHAILAGDEWAKRPPALSPDQAWSVVADVASVAHAVGVLDWHLLSAARAAGHAGEHLIEPLTAAAGSGLQPVAREVLHVASAGLLPGWDDPAATPVGGLALVVRSAEDVAEGARRLPIQVAAADDLSARTVAQLLVNHSKLLQYAAAGLRGVDDDASRRAGNLSGQLRQVLAFRGGVDSITPGETVPLSQTAQILQHVASIAPGAKWPPATAERYQPALAAIVAAAPELTQALSAHSDRAVAQGRWLVPAEPPESGGHPSWRQASPRDSEQPRMTTALARVADAAVQAWPPAEPVAPRARTGPALPPPREALRDVTVWDRERPARPGSRPGARLARRLDDPEDDVRRRHRPTTPPPAPRAGS